MALNPPKVLCIIFLVCASSSADADRGAASPTTSKQLRVPRYAGGCRNYGHSCLGAHGKRNSEVVTTLPLKRLGLFPPSLLVYDNRKKGYGPRVSLQGRKLPQFISEGMDPGVDIVSADGFVSTKKGDFNGRDYIGDTEEEHVFDFPNLSEEVRSRQGSNLKIPKRLSVNNVLDLIREIRHPVREDRNSKTIRQNA